MQEESRTIHTPKTIKKLADSMKNPAHEAANRRGVLKLAEKYDKTRRN